MELSKTDKKNAREIIETGLQKEFAIGLFGADTIIEGWKNKSKSNREAYHGLCKYMIDLDKKIARRYDGMTGSTYIFVLAGQLNEGIISAEDLNVFSEEIQQAIKMIAEF